MYDGSSVWLENEDEQRRELRRDCEMGSVAYQTPWGAGTYNI